MGATGDAVSFHPYLATDEASVAYQRLVYGGGLVERDPWHPEQFVPHLAERWTLGDDGVTYTFTLRPELVWSDGQPLTAYDFKWTYDHGLDPGSRGIDSYAALNAHTLVVRLHEPRAVGLEVVGTHPPLPRHVWERLDWMDPARNPEIFAPTVGAGPFRLVEWVRDSHASFVPNDHYFKGRPRLERYTVRVAGRPQLTLQWLKSGEVDRYAFSPEDAPEVRRLADVTVYEWWSPAAAWSFVGYNLRQPLLQDVRVRQALAYAVDREAIVGRLLDGLAAPLDSTYGPACWCYNPEVPRRGYDPVRARDLLDQAGFLPGPDGIRLKDGRRLQLRLIYGPSRLHARLAAVLQDSLQHVGVGLDIAGVEWTSYLTILKTPPFSWDLNLGAWRASIDPQWAYGLWSAAGIPELNSGAYRNPAVDDLFRQAGREADLAKRKPLYDEIQRILAEDQPYIFLFIDKDYEAVSNRIGGVQPTPLGIDWNLEEWYVR